MTTKPSTLQDSAPDITTSSDDDTSSTVSTTIKEIPKDLAPPPPISQQSYEHLNDIQYKKTTNNAPKNISLSLYSSKNYAQLKHRKPRKPMHIKNQLQMHSKSITDENTSSSLKTIIDLKKIRIYYEMNSFSYEWHTIDTLSTDDINDKTWLKSSTNLLYPTINSTINESKQNWMKTLTDEKSIPDILLADTTIEHITVSEFEYILNESRKSVINSPLYPHLGYCGYCKEFCTTLCDWSHEGVMAIKYISDTSNNIAKERECLNAHYAYWQRNNWQFIISPNGKSIAILFDKYLIIRSRDFLIDEWRILLSMSFQQFTKYRRMCFSAYGELLAVVSAIGEVFVYECKTYTVVMSFVGDGVKAGQVSGLVWRPWLSVNENEYWLEVILLMENGQMYRRGLGLDKKTRNVIQLENECRVCKLQYPHRKYHKWKYDGMDFYDAGVHGGIERVSTMSFMVVSCLPECLTDTNPRQSRLGSGLMYIRFVDDEPYVIDSYNTRIPSNSWFNVDSVCFTMADRRAKLIGRKISISPDGGHILCIDWRGNVEIYDCTPTTVLSSNATLAVKNIVLDMVVKIGNVREMSMGSYPAMDRIFNVEWWNSSSLVMVFGNNSFTITPLKALEFYRQRNRKWTINYLGREREKLYGYPMITKSVPIQPLVMDMDVDDEKYKNSSSDEIKNNFVDNEELRTFFILETSETYLRRLSDQQLKHFTKPKNDIERKQNEMYGWRKYKAISLSNFASLTPIQLFNKQLTLKDYERAIRIAKKFNLDTDIAYQSQFHSLLKQHNIKYQSTGNNTTNNNNTTTQTMDVYSINKEDTHPCSNIENEDSHPLTEQLIEILNNVKNRKWIIDTLMTVKISDFFVLDGLLFYGIRILESSEILRDSKPKAWMAFMKFRERLASLKVIMDCVPSFNILEYSQNDFFLENIGMDDEMDGHLVGKHLIEKYENYRIFRESDIISIAKQFAQKCLPALIICFIYHTHEISEELRLQILSEIPEVVHPNEYESILPRFSSPFWPNIKRWYALEFGLNDNIIEEEEKSVVKEKPVDGNILSCIKKWYKSRIYKLENATGNVENSLILCRIANENGFDFQSILKTLNILYLIIYDFNINDISLQKFESMDAESQLLFVLKYSTVENIMQHIKERAQYFICEEKLPLVLLCIIPEMAGVGKYLEVAEIFKNYGELDLLFAIVEYYSLSVSIFHGSGVLCMDDVHQLFIEYVMLCGLQYPQIACGSPWVGYRSLMNVIINLCKVKELDGQLKERVKDYVGIINGGCVLANSYDIQRSLVFYYSLYGVGHACE